MALGINRQPRVLLLHRPEQRVDLRQRFDLISEQLDPVGHLVVGRKDLDHVPPHPERPAPEVRVVPLVQNLHQPPRNILAADALAFFQQQQHPVVRFRRPQAVDAAHRADDDRVPSLEQAPRGRQPQLVQLLVDRRFLLDIKVPGRDVGLRLVVVVIAHKVFHSIRGKELLELVIKLRRQRLVVRQNQRRPVRGLDHLGHGERLARPRYPQQHLVLLARRQPLQQLLDRPRLIPPRLVTGHQLKVHAKIICEGRTRGEENGGG